MRISVCMYVTLDVLSCANECTFEIVIFNAGDVMSSLLFSVVVIFHIFVCERVYRQFCATGIAKHEPLSACMITLLKQDYLVPASILVFF